MFRIYVLDIVAEGFVNTECRNCPNLGNFHTISHSDEMSRHWRWRAKFAMRWNKTIFLRMKTYKFSTENYRASNYVPKLKKLGPKVKQVSTRCPAVSQVSAICPPNVRHPRKTPRNQSCPHLSAPVRQMSTNLDRNQRTPRTSRGHGDTWRTNASLLDQYESQLRIYASKLLPRV